MPEEKLAMLGVPKDVVLISNPHGAFLGHFSMIIFIAFDFCLCE